MIRVLWKNFKYKMRLNSMKNMWNDFVEIFVIICLLYVVYNSWVVEIVRVFIIRVEDERMWYIYII